MPIVALTALLLALGDAATTATPGSRSPWPVALERALAALLEQQSQGEPGWAWDVTLFGSDEPAANTGGVIANALLDSYRRRPHPSTLVTLIQYGEHLERAPSSERELAYKADIEFLARAGRLGLLPHGESAAAERFAHLRARSPSGTSEYRRIATGRGELAAIVGYDVALAIRAALAVNERTYGIELAEAYLAAEPLGQRGGRDPFAVLSTAALTLALARLDEPRLDAALATGRQLLVAWQRPNGAWAENNSQTTAYALMALAGAKGTTPERLALERGRAWLASTQLSRGAFPAYHDGLPEPFVGPIIPLAEAEVLAALVATAE